MINAITSAVLIVTFVLFVEGFSFSTTESLNHIAPRTTTNLSSHGSCTNQDGGSIDLSRRESFASMMGAVVIGATMLSSPRAASAVADCMTDCVKNCLAIAPKDKEYCTDSCTSYCAQDDRTDGLSGSVSAANGEVGILGGSFGQGTVPKGEDKPPSVKIPGLDFSSASGKKLLGY